MTDTLGRWAMMIEGFGTLTEAQSEASKQAHNLGLEYAGFGRWRDPKTGKIVARTIDGKLMKYHEPDENPSDAAQGTAPSSQGDVGTPYQALDKLTRAAMNHVGLDKIFEPSSFQFISDVIKGALAGHYFNIWGPAGHSLTKDQLKELESFVFHLQQQNDNPYVQAVKSLAGAPKVKSAATGEGFSVEQAMDLMHVGEDDPNFQKIAKKIGDLEKATKQYEVYNIGAALKKLGISKEQWKAVLKYAQKTKDIEQYEKFGQSAKKKKAAGQGDAAGAPAKLGVPANPPAAQKPFGYEGEGLPGVKSADEYTGEQQNIGHDAIANIENELDEGPGSLTSLVPADLHKPFRDLVMKALFTADPHEFEAALKQMEHIGALQNVGWSALVHALAETRKEHGLRFEKKPSAGSPAPETAFSKPFTDYTTDQQHIAQEMIQQFNSQIGAGDFLVKLVPTDKRPEFSSVVMAALFADSKSVFDAAMEKLEGGDLVTPAGKKYVKTLGKAIEQARATNGIGFSGEEVPYEEDDDAKADAIVKAALEKANLSYTSGIITPKIAAMLKKAVKYEMHLYGMSGFDPSSFNFLYDVGGMSMADVQNIRNSIQQQIEDAENAEDAPQNPGIEYSGDDRKFIADTAKKFDALTGLNLQHLPAKKKEQFKSQLQTFLHAETPEAAIDALSPLKGDIIPKESWQDFLALVGISPDFAKAYGLDAQHSTEDEPSEEEDGSDAVGADFLKSVEALKTVGIPLEKMDHKDAIAVLNAVNAAMSKAQTPDEVSYFLAPLLGVAEVSPSALKQLQNAISDTAAAKEPKTGGQQGADAKLAAMDLNDLGKTAYGAVADNVDAPESLPDFDAIMSIAAQALDQDTLKAAQDKAQGLMLTSIPTSQALNAAHALLEKWKEMHPDAGSAPPAASPATGAKTAGIELSPYMQGIPVSPQAEKAIETMKSKKGMSLDAIAQWAYKKSKKPGTKPKDIPGLKSIVLAAVQMGAASPLDPADAGKMKTLYEPGAQPVAAPPEAGTEPKGQDEVSEKVQFVLDDMEKMGFNTMKLTGAQRATLEQTIGAALQPGLDASQQEQILGALVAQGILKPYELDDIKSLVASQPKQTTQSSPAHEPDIPNDSKAESYLAGTLGNMGIDISKFDAETREALVKAYQEAIKGQTVAGVALAFEDIANKGILQPDTLDSLKASIVDQMNAEGILDRSPDAFKKHLDYEFFLNQFLSENPDFAKNLSDEDKTALLDAMKVGLNASSYAEAKAYYNNKLVGKIPGFNETIFQKWRNQLKDYHDKFKFAQEAENKKKQEKKEQKKAAEELQKFFDSLSGGEKDKLQSIVKTVGQGLTPDQQKHLVSAIGKALAAPTSQDMLDALDDVLGGGPFSGELGGSYAGATVPLDKTKRDALRKMVAGLYGKAKAAKKYGEEPTVKEPPAERAKHVFNNWAHKFGMTLNHVPENNGERGALIHGVKAALEEDDPEKADNILNSTLLAATSLSDEQVAQLRDLVHQEREHPASLNGGSPAKLFKPHAAPTANAQSVGPEKYAGNPELKKKLKYYGVPLQHAAEVEKEVLTALAQSVGAWNRKAHVYKLESALGKLGVPPKTAHLFALWATKQAMDNAPAAEKAKLWAKENGIANGASPSKYVGGAPSGKDQAAIKNWLGNIPDAADPFRIARDELVEGETLTAGTNLEFTASGFAAPPGNVSDAQQQEQWRQKNLPPKLYKRWDNAADAWQYTSQWEYKPLARKAMNAAMIQAIEGPPPMYTYQKTPLERGLTVPPHEFKEYIKAFKIGEKVYLGPSGFSAQSGLPRGKASYLSPDNVNVLLRILPPKSGKFKGCRLHDRGNGYDSEKEVVMGTNRNTRCTRVVKHITTTGVGPVISYEIEMQYEEDMNESMNLGFDLSNWKGLSKDTIKALIKYNNTSVAHVPQPKEQS